MINIEKKQIRFNISKRNEQISYIVIHYTGNYSKGADPSLHYEYFNGGDRQSSADFFVDDKTILQINDYKTNYTWAVGDGKGAWGITNRNSLSIEICVNPESNLSLAITNAAKLTAYLMKELDINISNVVRHYDASKKLCPMFFCKDQEYRFLEFKEEVGVFMKKDYKQILSESGLSNPEKWIQIITDLESGKINLEDIQYLKWFKSLVEKLGSTR